jgi:predicted DCC family thiol-disulfide oxidoreductase YuxK
MADPPIILFDGVCNFCNGSVNFIMDRDPGGRLRFASQQSKAGGRLIRQYRLPATISTLVLIDCGHAYTKSAAALRIAKYLAFPWSLFQAAVIIPRPIADAAYDVLAANRYRWFGRTDTCRMPSPGIAWRFLED